MTISRARLARLEQRRRGRAGCLAILCAASGVWADPGAKPPGIWSAGSNHGHKWERAAGENEDAFLGRVLSAAGAANVDVLHYGDAPADIAHIRRAFGVAVFDERTFLAALFRRPDAPGAAP